eukprot:gene6070-4368_t
MRRLQNVFVSLNAPRRWHASYGVTSLGHKDLLLRYGDESCGTKSILSLLEATEDRISRWKLNKWEFRVPPLLSTKEKEKMLIQLNLLKSFFLEWGKTMHDVRHDLELVSSIGGISKEEVRSKDRAWLLDAISKLRWNNEVNKAKCIRDAFTRLEIYGARDYRILERLAAIYGLGMFNTFQDAFSNLIIEEPSRSRSVQTNNPFTELLSSIVTQNPQISLVYDFLGFNPSQGYRESLRKFLLEAARKRHDLAGAAKGRLLANSARKKVVLFDFVDSHTLLASEDTGYGLPDFLYIHGAHFYLITIASDNYWLRNRQLPHRKQMEGIGRRGSFVLGIPFSDVRIKNVLLPPHYLDKDSIVRLLEGLFDMELDQWSSTFPWVRLYDKQLDEQDADFAEMIRRNRDEEWLTL